jgi:hypothetical protein
MYRASGAAWRSPRSGSPLCRNADASRRLARVTRLLARAIRPCVGAFRSTFV